MIARKEKTFDQFTNNEVLTALLHLTDHLVKWMEQEGIRAGSTANYDLYAATKTAITSEWERTTGKRLKVGSKPSPKPRAKNAASKKTKSK